MVTGGPSSLHPGNKLARSHQWFERVADTTPNIIYIFSIVDHRFVYMNESLTRILGYPGSHIHGGDFLRRVVYPDDLPAVEENFRNMAYSRPKEIRKWTNRVRDKDGGIRWIENAVSPFSLDDTDRVVEVIGIANDITDRVAADKALHESRKDLDRAQAVGHIGSWRLNTGKNELTWSDEAYRIFDVPAGTPLSYETFLSFVHPDDREYVNQSWNATQKRDPYDIEHRLIVRGGIKWVREKAELEFGEDGVLRGAFGIVQDITDRKKIEDTLRRNEYEFRTLVDNSPDMVFRLNRQLEYVFVNPAFEKITGLTQERSIGRSNDQLGMSRREVEFWRSTLQEVIENGREKAVEFDISSFFGKRFFSVRIVPEFERSGLVETILVIAHDITERRRAEERIRYISFHDEVTGLFNRAFFEEELRRLDTERDMPISIIMGDVDNLKLTNDVFGHEEGDKLLKVIADGIRSACRKDDIAARWGGDEFTVILPRTDHAAVVEICDRIGQITRASKGTVLRPSVAIGMAVKDNRNQNIYAIIRRAEQRMYDHKLARARENKNAVLSALRNRIKERTAQIDAHIGRSHELARRFGAKLGLSEDQTKDLSMLIELHDIGNVVVPGDILAKPGKLNDEEWNIIKKHSEAGFKITKTFADTVRISDEIFSHGEHWDGSGYPRGLRGKDIPYLVRIFLIIDAYDAMTHFRPYAHPLTHEEALQEIRRNAGKQFDPELADIFISMLAAYSPVS